MIRSDDMPPRFVRLAAAIRAELEQLRKVTAEAELALRDFSAVAPPPRELRGIGAIVHDFYTGTEHVFEKIAVELDGGAPGGPAWHRELLESMALDLPGLRPSVLTVATARALQEFLRFRHLFRNVYGFELEWQRLEPRSRGFPRSHDSSKAKYKRSCRSSTRGIEPRRHVRADAFGCTVRPKGSRDAGASWRWS